MVINSTEVTIQKQGSIREKVRRFLFGDDIFISYSRVDSTYALSLANKLQAKPNNLSCFLDQWGTPPGEKLPDELIDTIRKCSTMVLIGSKNAADSENVGLEVKEFLETKRPIIPITFVADEIVTNIPEDFNKQNLIGTLEQSEWHSLIKGIAKTTEVLSALKTRTPSENVVLRIVNSVEFRSRNKRLRKTLFTTLGGIAILILLAFFIVKSAQSEAKAANAERTKAETNANAAVQRQQKTESELSNANQQLSSTIKNLTEADSKLENANTELKTAETKITNAETQLTKSRQELKIAQTETEKAQNEADQQTKIAEEKRKEAAEQGKRSRQLTYASQIKSAKYSYDKDDIKTFIDRLNKTNGIFRGLEWNYLNHLNEGIIPFDIFNAKDRKEKDHIERIAFSPGGKYLTAESFTTTSEKTLLVWNAKTGDKINFILNLTEDVNYVFSPDGNWFAACLGNKFKLWNTASSSWTEIQIPSFAADASISEPKEKYRFVSFKNSEKILTVSEKDKKSFLQKWSAKTGKQIDEKLITDKIPGTVSNIQGFVNNELLLITYQKNNTFGQETKISQTSLFTDELTEIKLDQIKSGDNRYFSPANEQIVVKGIEASNQSIEIWQSYRDASSKAELPDSADYWKDIVFSPDGKFIAALSMTEIKVWDTKTRTILTKLHPPYIGLAGSIAFTADSSRIAVGGSFADDPEGNEDLAEAGSILSVWNIYQKGDVFKFNDESLIGLSSDGLEAVTTDRNDTKWNLHFWNTLKIKPSITLNTQDKKTNAQNEFPFQGWYSPGNSRLAVSFTELNKKKVTSLKLFEPRTGKEIPLELIDNCTVTGKPKFSKNGQRLVDFCEDGSLLMWDFDLNGKPEHFVIDSEKNNKTDDPQESNETKSSEQIRQALDSNQIQLLQTDKKLIVILSDDIFFDSGESFVWDVSSKKLQKVCPDEDIVKVSPDGKRWITRDNESNFRLRDVDEDRCIETEPFSTDFLFDVAFSNDGNYLAWYSSTSPDDISADTKYFIKDLVTNKDIPPIIDEHIKDGIGKITFSPTNKWVIFGNSYWNRNFFNKKNKFTLFECADSPTFSTDESRLITSCGGNYLKFWNLESGLDVLDFQIDDSHVSKAVILQGDSYFITFGDYLRLFRVKPQFNEDGEYMLTNLTNKNFYRK